MKKITIFVLLSAVLQLSAQYSSTRVQGLIVPKYMGSGSGRLPVMCRLRIVGLDANTMYQYSTRGMSAADVASNSDFTGAGNAMMVDTNGFKYNASGTFPSWTNNATIDTFYTDKTGSYEGWFGFVYTTNTRFASGKHVYFGITARGGTGPTTYRMYCSDSVRALAFSSTSNTGDSFCTALWGKSMTTARNFVATYDDVVGLDRPLTLTYAESEGIAVAFSATFYADSVNGKAGHWGAIMPNTNSNGVRRVVSYDFKTARELYANTDADGVWGPNAKNTVNPKGGLTPVGLGLDEAALTSPLVEFWSRTSTTTENKGTTEVYVTRKYSNDANQSVRLFVNGGDAVKNTDYTISEPKTITFKPGGQTSDTTKITLVDDNASENTETILLRLDQASNCVIGTEVAHTVNVKDDDIPNIVLGPTRITIKENANKVGVKIKMDKALTTISEIQLFVKYRGDSTLIPGEFSLGSSNTDSVFNLGKTTGADSVTIFAKITDDFKTDPNDTIILCVRQISGVATLADSLFTLVMTDNDGPAQIRFAGTAQSVLEKDPEAIVKVVVASRSDASSDFTLRDLSSVSTATDGSDYTFGTAKITTIDEFTPDTIEFRVPIINDNDFESQEKIYFVIENLSNTRILSPDTFVVTITSDDLPLYPIAKVNTQSGSALVADSLNVKCRVTGTVLSGNLRATPGLNFVINDNTGGIAVFASNRNFGYTPKVGDSLMIQGTVRQFWGTVQMDFLDTIILIAGNRKLPAAALVNDMIEGNESKLVQVRRVKLVDPSEWPATALNNNQFKYVRYQNTDGTIDTLNIDAETELDGTTAPSGYLNITGICQQFDNSSPFTSRYTLTPRSIADFEKANLPKINFIKSSDTITELADSFRFELEVLPTEENFTFDVVAIGGTAVSPRDYDFSGRTINVLKNNSYFSGKANISDDNESDGQQTLKLGIRNINGPGEAGKDSVLTLVIKDNEASATRNLNLGNIRMFPNPAAGIVFFKSAESMQQIEVFTIEGKKVIQINPGANRAQLSVNLPAGMYSVTVQTTNGVFSDKLMVK
jgi:DNA/RNA endonuclease YhcR with UshA esterase domain